MIRLHRPLKGTFTITQAFGPSNITSEPPAFGYPHFHLGVDYAMAEGSCVLAPSFGRVLTAGWDDTGFGECVRVDHGNGVVSLLGHLSAYRCAPGDQVNQGELVAVSGNSGNSSGPHLHWSVLVNGVWTNPALFVFGP